MWWAGRSAPRSGSCHECEEVWLLPRCCRSLPRHYSWKCPNAQEHPVHIPQSNHNKLLYVPLTKRRAGCISNSSRSGSFHDCVRVWLSPCCSLSLRRHYSWKWSHTHRSTQYTYPKALTRSYCMYQRQDDERDAVPRDREVVTIAYEYGDCHGVVYRREREGEHKVGRQSHPWHRAARDRGKRSMRPTRRSATSKRRIDINRKKKRERELNKNAHIEFLLMKLIQQFSKHDLWLER